MLTLKNFRDLAALQKALSTHIHLALVEHLQKPLNFRVQSSNVSPEGLSGGEGLIFQINFRVEVHEKKETLPQNPSE